MAKDLNEFWRNLLAGKDCIVEIPKERWDWREYYGDPREEGNKTKIKWGGFIEGIDEFDPLFFGISPREAEMMDPQQRLLMMYVWKAIEDAGYSAESLSGTQTAIFVGTTNSGYSDVIAKAALAIEGYSSTGVLPSVGPNRMSYFLNLHGPSEPIETACSSSLIAIHRAMEAIANGSCEMAIVGGINTMITPAAALVSLPVLLSARVGLGVGEAAMFPGATVFQYDYLNDDVENVFDDQSIFGGQSKLPQNLRNDLANPDIKWIIFINPPYERISPG